ncbi:hypothetical protein HYZ98_04425 [Candidatus Peregrinibacteria bacterium]|nr:hypothetical protein [Candidatus Peregrinibacteria bacterium]
MSKLKNFVTNILLLLITLALTLGMTEYVFRLVKTPVSGWEKKQIFHPDLFTIETPMITWTKKTDEFETVIQTNRSGFRGAPFPTKTELLFIGDSMTAAHQVDEEKRFPRLLNGVALGMNGADPIQELQFYRKIGRALHPNVVIHQIFPFNDIIEPGPSFTVRNNRINTIMPQKPDEPICMKFWHMKSYFLMRLCEFVRYHYIKATLSKEHKEKKYGIFEGKIDLDLTFVTLQTFKEEVEKDGGIYIVLIIPYQKEVEGSVSHALYNNILEKLNDFAVIDPLPTFQESNEGIYFPNDGHLTQAGHKILADLIRLRLGNILYNPEQLSTLSIHE